MNKPNKKAPNVADFARGQKDCREGVSGKLNASDDYNRGYGVQYEIEQRLNHEEFN